MQKFTHNSLNLHYQILGTGKPVLLLHGFLEDHAVWETISPFFLENGFSLILVDLPCHGLSRLDGDECSMADMAGILDAFLNDQKIENPFVFGHSMGGYVGLELLRLRNLKLTLVHSNFWADSPDKQKDRNRVIEVVKTNKNLFLSEAIPNLFAQENRIKCEMMIRNLIADANGIPANEIAMATAGMRDRKPAYDLLNRHSINLIQGTNDTVVSSDFLEAECKKLKQRPTIFFIQNCGHMSFWEQPESLINHLKSIVID